MSEITTDDIEHLPHIVILRTGGVVGKLVDFDCGSKAHAFAMKCVTDNSAGEIIVCIRVRCLESFDHRMASERN